jgi:uncharacterized membrane protein
MDMEWYDLLAFFHVGAAIVWVGGATMIQVFALRALARQDPLAMVQFTRDVEWIGNRVMLPSALVVIAFGFLLVWDGPWELTTTWIWVSLLIYAISFVVGLFVLTPEAKKIGDQIEAEGPESAAVQARIGRILNISRIDLILLFAIVFLMVTKPI